MMELSHSLLLNEVGLKQTPDPNKPVFFYEWLKYLERILPVTQKADIRSSQKQLIEQLTQRISSGLGPTTRALLAKCIAQVFLIADSYDLFQTVNLCNDLLKSKDDSNAQIQAKLTALAVLGAMYEHLGKMVSRSYEESFDIMTKWIKSAESNSRAEILMTMCKMVHGLGSSAYSRHRDIFKVISKNSLTDRVMFVRIAAIKCLRDLCGELGSPIYPIDVDSIMTVALKAMNQSTSEVRFEVAKVFGKIASYAVNNKEQKPVSGNQQQNQPKAVTLDIVLKFMSEAFLKGGLGGFLKAGSNPSHHRDIRIGIALAYVEVARELGSKWLERNLLFWQKHLFELANNMGSLLFAPDVVYPGIDARHYISYIFRQTLGQMLSENAQINACKNFGSLISEALEKMVVSNEDTERIMVDDGISVSCTVALLEISALVRQVNSSIAPLFVEANGIQEPLFECVSHPAQMVRLAAAWCLRCVIRSVPTQATPLINLCLVRLRNDRKTSLAIAGFSTALASLTAGSQQTELGIPFQKTHDVFEIGREMVVTTQDRMKLALSKSQYGWMLITSVLSMGGSYIRRNLRHLLPLWRCSFPRSVEEAKAEIQRGDAFTWECSLRSRAGAFGSMEALVVHASELMNEELLKQIVLLIEVTLHTMSVLASNNLLRAQPVLRQPVQLLRIRLYALLNRIPFKYYEHLFRILLSELVADITLSDNPQLATTPSHLINMCTAVGECLLGGCLASQNELEVQLNSAQCECSGALEYDPICVVFGATTWNHAQELDADDPNWPQPLPPQISSLDAAIQTFGRIYPLLVTKHKIQLTDHFIKCLSDQKQQSPARFQAIEVNILSSMLCAMRSMSDYRNARIEDEELRRKTVQLLREYICSNSPILRCLAVETMSRLAQTIAEPQFVAVRTTEIFEELRTKQDEKSRAGLTLALGTLYRYKGSLGSDQHFKKAVGDLLTSSQIDPSPTVQAWSILSLSLIASTGGGMFREYVKPSLEFCLRQLLNTPSNNVEVVQCIGKFVSALITSVGPDLASVPTTPGGGTIEEIRQSCITACSLMFSHPDAQVRAEAIACQQQLHLFAPRYVELDRLVANLCDLLYSPHRVLRLATIQCLKQLLQREAREVREHAQNLLPAGIFQTKWKQSPLPETGIDGALFELLDLESDIDQRQNIKDCLLFLVQTTSDEQLNFWLSLCKDILASSTTTNSDSTLRSTLVVQQDQKTTGNDSPKPDQKESNLNALDDDDDDALQSAYLGESRVRDRVSPRWPTRVFAFTIVRKLMSLCDTERAHLDPVLAKEIQASNGRADYLVFHLADLVRMSFMGATSENSSLRLAGLACLQDIIDRFSEVQEPEVQEPHVILEQFQAQVSSALGPAFDPDTPPHVTSAACQVCSAWICSGVAKNLNDLRRVNQLLVSSLEKLKDNSMNAQLYNESAATLEKLSILKAWAEVYVVALKRQESSQLASRWPESKSQTTAIQPMEFDYSGSSATLLDLVNPELSSLVGHWLSAALRDAAILSLSSDFQLPQVGGTFYTVESADACREYYATASPSLLLAASMWLRQNNFATDLFNSNFGSRKTSLDAESDAATIAFRWTDKERRRHFDLILAMSVESLCTANKSASGDDRLIHTSLDTLSNIIECPWAQFQLMSDVRLPIEIMNVLHRLILTNDNLQVQSHCADVVQSLLNAACVTLKVVASEKDNGNLPEALLKSSPTSFDGFDPDSGKIHSQSSLVFAILEVCLCLLVRQIPQVNPAKSNSIAPLHFRKYGRLSAESNELIRRAVGLLTKLESLCTPHGAIVFLPSIMFLVLGVLKESSRIDKQRANEAVSSRGHITEAAQSAIKAIRTIVSRSPVDNTFEQWAPIIRSSLLSLLKMTEEVDEKGPVDEAVVMVAVCVVLTNLSTTSSSPARLFIGSVLFQKVCELIRSCLESPNQDVQYKALQTVNSLFSRKGIAAAYVKELGPNVFAKLKPYFISTDKGKAISETDLPVLSNISDVELLIIQEAIKAVEAVLSMAKGEKEFTFVNLLTRCLARFLCPEPERQLKEVEENVRTLHDFAYQRLNLIGPAHPEPFSKLIKNSAPLRKRIEAAAQIIAKQQHQEKQNQLLQQQKALAVRQQALKLASQQPAIELKTFANLPAVEKDF